MKVDKKDKQNKTKQKTKQGYKNGVKTEVGTQTTFSKVLYICP